MTLITFKDGKPVLRAGKVGTEQACCCGCTCDNCEAHIYVNGVEVPFTPFTDFWGNPTCDQCAAAVEIPCTATPPWDLAAAGEEIFSPYIDCDDPQPDPENPLYRIHEFTNIECSYRAAACYLCENDAPVVRIHYFAIYTVAWMGCAGGLPSGSTESTTFVTRFWYRDYALPLLPACDGPTATLEQVGDDVDLWELDTEGTGCAQQATGWASPGWGEGEMCGCDLTASILCVGPDFP